MDYRAGRWRGSRQPNSEQKKQVINLKKIIIINVKYHFQPIFSKAVRGYGRGMYSAVPLGRGDTAGGYWPGPLQMASKVCLLGL